MDSHFQAPAIQNIPNEVSVPDRQRLARTTTPTERIALCEDMILCYPGRPSIYFEVQLATTLGQLGAKPLALAHFRKAQTLLAQDGGSDDSLDILVEILSREVAAESAKHLANSMKTGPFSQKWIPTKAHRFPTTQPYLPAGHEELKKRWSTLSAQTSLSQAYLRKLAVDTNHFEDVFRLTEESVKDVVKRGIADSVLEPTAESKLHDADKIRQILSDTISAYGILDELLREPEKLNRSSICEAHARLMHTCRFLEPGRYIPPGETRSTTRTTVDILGYNSAQCCPFTEVDKEVDYICNMSKQWIRSWRNPFATASWIHLVLTRCNPFDDGNGRIARIIASIPLVKTGYPPISITMSHRTSYYAAIPQAYDGDHSPFIQCLVDGMRDTISYVQGVA
ncbi:hypothetical protein L226DRAFT_528334 [Lentinus tigrinus ALCF2SS1-7]|uniref:uncharacterized protein n=1 Tax=Lentinus tigrinus ALCF2SS1-7 TaxID=1328758 RepID=UPI001165E0C8|nr:hypothetical protein L226DRAFT_528334 [Lentinus tigrinus ALCF2SS1-7]